MLDGRPARADAGAAVHEALAVLAEDAFAPGAGLGLRRRPRRRRRRGAVLAVPEEGLEGVLRVVEGVEDRGAKAPSPRRMM